MATAETCVVHIVLPGASEPVPGGRLVREQTPDGTWVGRFGYARSYLARAGAVPLDPLHIPLREDLYETTLRQGIPGAIRDGMPDYWGRYVLARRAGVAELGEMECLLAEATDRIGALVFSRGTVPPDLTSDPTLTLEELFDAADVLAADQDAVLRSTNPRSAAMYLALDAAGLLVRTSAIGGARPKATLIVDGERWIAKFPKRNDMWDDPLVEYAMLRLAAEAGIDVPAVRLEKVHGRSVLLVRRFDRRVDASTGAVTRARVLSGLTLLDSEEHSWAAGEWSYLRLADQLGLVSGTPTEDRRALFRRMVFNACISNEDDHPRNHAVVAHDAAFRLSPVYDLTPTSQHGEVRRLAMVTGVDEEGRDTKAANAEVMLRAAPRFGGLAQEEAAAIIRDVSTTVGARWDAVVRDAGGTQRDRELIQSAFVPPAFWHGWPDDLEPPPSDRVD